MLATTNRKLLDFGGGNIPLTAPPPSRYCKLSKKQLTKHWFVTEFCMDWKKIASNLIVPLPEKSLVISTVYAHTNRNWKRKTGQDLVDFATVERLVEETLYRRYGL